MVVAVMEITLHAHWVHSLKEKRSEVKRLTAKIRQTFNVSVIESDEQDVHQIIALGIAALTATTAQADSVQENIRRFVEQNSEADVVSVETEHR